MAVNTKFRYYVKYVGGLTSYVDQSEGVLSLSDNYLEFKGKKFGFSFSAKQIIDVTTSETDDTAKAVGTYLAIGLMGFAATRSMTKDRIMKVVYSDDHGNLQSPAFKFLPQSAKEVGFIQDARSKLLALKQTFNVSTTTEAKPPQVSIKADSDESGSTGEIFCDQCGNKNRAEAKFCKKCGAKLVN
ncbi:MAG: zinc ribbon domain-containing protein [Candidatus Bathyarchaeia archaeon]|jgi:hypothetical protein